MKYISDVNFSNNKIPLIKTKNEELNLKTKNEESIYFGCIEPTPPNHANNKAISPLKRSRSLVVKIDINNITTTNSSDEIYPPTPYELSPRSETSMTEIEVNNKFDSQLEKSHISVSATDSPIKSLPSSSIATTPSSTCTVKSDEDEFANESHHLIHSTMRIREVKNQSLKLEINKNAKFIKRENLKLLPKLILDKVEIDLEFSCQSFQGSTIKDSSGYKIERWGGIQIDKDRFCFGFFENQLINGLGKFETSAFEIYTNFQLGLADGPSILVYNSFFIPKANSIYFFDFNRGVRDAEYFKLINYDLPILVDEKCEIDIQTYNSKWESLISDIDFVLNKNFFSKIKFKKHIMLPLEFHKCYVGKNFIEKNQILIPNGMGLLLINRNLIYYGYFKDGLPHGLGVLKTATHEFVCNFNFGIAEGFGYSITKESQEVMRRNYTNGEYFRPEI